MSEDLLKDYEQYTKMYKKDPFANDTIEMEEQLLKNIGVSRRDKWIKVIEKTATKHGNY